jgi:hypothetical protein
MNQKKQRLEGENMTVRKFISDLYHEMIEIYGSVAKKRYPNLTYGQSKYSKNKSYPYQFKRYFFNLLKTFIHTDKGIKRINNAPTAFFLTGNKCSVHTKVCPEDCQFITANKKVLLRSQLRRKAERVRLVFNLFRFLQLIGQESGEERINRIKGRNS